MVTQRHQIMRQVLEAHRCPSAAASRIQSELRVTYYQRLLPLIETICSELSTPGRINRIDTLEINLGEVPLDTLESAVADRFGTAFTRKLAEAIDGAPEIDSDLELFSYFVRTGTVPWWADRADRGLLDTSLHALIRRAPQAVRSVVAELPDQERARHRIVRAYSDQVLDRLAAIFAPQLAARDAGVGSAWVAVVESASLGRGYPVRAARDLWWQEILRAAGRDDAAASDAPQFFREVLTHVARPIGLDYRSLLGDLRRAIGTSPVLVPPWTRDIADHLWLELGGDVKPTPASVHEGAMQRPTSASESAGPGIRRVLAMLERGAPHPADLWVQLREVIDRLPAQRRAGAVAAFETAQSAASRGEVARSVASDALAAVMRSALNRGPDAPDVGRPVRKPALDVSATDVPARDVSAPGVSISGVPRKSPLVYWRFSDAEEIYVDNAGLVILWPFLERFFMRLGMVEEQAFKDAAAMHRAVGLLQHVATGEQPKAEYLVPLNKVLCGMAPEEVVDFGPDLTDLEIEECTDLLAAVIQHAPILHDMSIPGFRASFLLRRGQLGSRDGQWLLRVERETHDIVLDRFPWTVHLVKLPWMAAMMQVEW